MKNLNKMAFSFISFFLVFTSNLQAQHEERAEDEKKTDSMEVYGFTQADAGYNFNQIDPKWFDVVRPTKLPSFKNEFGTNGNVYFSVRQTRFGVKNYFNTPLGQLKTHFEFEMFGTGAFAGETTIRLRHAYGELGKFGAGQYWSPFMDIDVFPNTLEYWGPNGMAFFRNVQIRYMPIKGEFSRLTFALERPGASADQGQYRSRIELQNISPRFPMPDLSGEYRLGGKWGYVELAGIYRRIEWKHLNTDTFNLSGHANGWGLNFSTNIKFGKQAVFKGQALYGKGIENYMNDAPEDIGIKNNFSNPTTPIVGVALPVLGIVAFLDLNWSKKFTSSLGYSRVDISNSNGQNNSAFKYGQYAIVNLLYYPSENVMAGIEYQWGDRHNYRDGFKTSISKIQVSFRYKFSQYIYRYK